MGTDGADPTLVAFLRFVFEFRDAACLLLLSRSGCCRRVATYFFQRSPRSGGAKETRSSRESYFEANSHNMFVVVDLFSKAMRRLTAREYIERAFLGD